MLDRKLIVLEGLDGSGKTTQTSLLHGRLIDSGKPVRQIKLPNYADPSSTLVKMYLGGDFGNDPDAVNAYAASTFYAVDRYASFQRFWKEDYERGVWLLADRYTTSNAIYQMAKLPKTEWKSYLEWLEDFEYNKIGIPSPDFVMFLDMPIEVSQRLMTARYNGAETDKDVHERNIRYLEDCREAAMFLCDYWNWVKIPCAQNGEPLTPEEISDKVFEAAAESLGLRREK